MTHSSHQLPGAAALRENERIADEGESGETPFILIGEVWTVVAAAVLVLLAVAVFAYRLAT
jgi:hypothetical protein